MTKKILVFSATLIIALVCSFCSILNTILPESLSSVVLMATVLILSLIWIAFVLKTKLRVFKLGRQRINWIWILSAIMIPLTYIFAMFFINGSVIVRKYTFSLFFKTVLLSLFTEVFVKEIAFRSLILNESEGLFGKIPACIFTSVVYVVFSVRNIHVGFVQILQQITVPFFFSSLLCLIALHTESLISGFFLALVFKISEVLVCFGPEAENFSILFFKSDINPWVMVAVKSSILIVFIAIAVVLLIKKRKEEVLYW